MYGQVQFKLLLYVHIRKHKPEYPGVPL